PGQPLASIAEAMNRMAEDRSGVVMVTRGMYPGKLLFHEEEKKKELKDWPPEPDNLNVKWW
ncbi:hypothetical protein LCGC14_3081820, partial [marine sediment metagenome]